MKRPLTKTVLLPALFLLYSCTVSAQVQVSKESHHKKVLENKYFRLLDVWIEPGDTTLFHIHSRPSLFLPLTNTNVGTQVMGKEWEKKRNEAGRASYTDFKKDPMVHRVTNMDSSIFHVSAIELLSSFKHGNEVDPLPYTVLFDNDWATAYKLTQASLDKKIISSRGPIIAELVKGQELIIYDVVKKKQTSITAGGYWYIKPLSSFYISAKTDDTIDLVLFEIK